MAPERNLTVTINPGIRISCAKRPVSAADMERLVGEIESALQAMGRAEVSSRVVGDMVIVVERNGSHCLYSLRDSLLKVGRSGFDPQRNRSLTRKLIHLTCNC